MHKRSTRSTILHRSKPEVFIRTNVNNVYFLSLFCLQQIILEIILLSFGSENIKL